MSDLIDRQAVIDAIQKLNIPEDMCVFEIISHIEVAIATLPSAEPIDVQKAYYKGKIDGIKECTAKLKKVNEELAKGGEE